MLSLLATIWHLVGKVDVLIHVVEQISLKVGCVVIVLTNVRLCHIVLEAHLRQKRWACGHAL